MGSDRIFVAVDWMNLEGRLWAWFSKDPVMQARLDDELAGGHKLHAINAGIIYGIDPAEAKDHLVQFQGQELEAYDGGKRVSHMWNYGAKAKKAASMFWLPINFCEDVWGRLNEEYKTSVDYRRSLVDEVFGVYRYSCKRCGYSVTGDPVRCPYCSGPKSAVLCEYSGVEREGEHVLYTPFRRRRLYYGRRGEGANAVAAQLPQSSGASMWYRTHMRLTGYDYYTQAPWPVPSDTLVWTPQMMYSALYGGAETSVTTGTYDSFVVETVAQNRDLVLDWLVWTVEQPWPELDGLRIPGEGSYGWNWREKGPGNEHGLQKSKRRPLSTPRPTGLLVL